MSFQGTRVSDVVVTYMFVLTAGPWSSLASPSSFLGLSLSVVAASSPFSFSSSVSLLCLLLASCVLGSFFLVRCRPLVSVSSEWIAGIATPQAKHWRLGRRSSG